MIYVSLPPLPRPEALGADLKQRRKRVRNMTLDKAAKVSGYSRTYLCSIEKGHVANPSYHVVLTLLKLYRK